MCWAVGRGIQLLIFRGGLGHKASTAFCWPLSAAYTGWQGQGLPAPCYALQGLPTTGKGQQVVHTSSPPQETAPLARVNEGLVASHCPLLALASAGEGQWVACVSSTFTPPQGI